MQARWKRPGGWATLAIPEQYQQHSVNTWQYSGNISTPQFSFCYLKLEVYFWCTCKCSPYKKSVTQGDGSGGSRYEVHGYSWQDVPPSLVQVGNWSCCDSPVFLFVVWGHSVFWDIFSEDDKKKKKWSSKTNLARRVLNHWNIGEELLN